MLIITYHSITTETAHYIIVITLNSKYIIKTNKKQKYHM